jgi:hypothetical protein
VIYNKNLIFPLNVADIGSFADILARIHLKMVKLPRFFLAISDRQNEAFSCIDKKLAKVGSQELLVG